MNNPNEAIEFMTYEDAAKMVETIQDVYPSAMPSRRGDKWLIKLYSNGPYYGQLDDAL